MSEGSGEQEFIWGWLKAVFFGGLTVIVLVMLVAGYIAGRQNALGASPPPAILQVATPSTGLTLPQCIEHCHHADNVKHFDRFDCSCLTDEP